MVNFIGTSGNDIFTGGVDNDRADGFAGNDSLSGAGGNDTLVGGAGADTLDGGDGDDRLYSDALQDGSLDDFIGRASASLDQSAEPDVLRGGAGDDYIYAGYGDYIDGGPQGSFGNRLSISFMGSPSGVNADFRPLQNGQAMITIGTTYVTNIQNTGYIQGSNFDDIIAPIDTYYPTSSYIYGMGGNDTIYASYYSGFGGGGLNGGDGDDTIDARVSGYGVASYGDAGQDTIYGSNSGNNFGGAGNDLIYGYNGVTHGDAGDDRLIIANSSYYNGAAYGDEGNDRIDATAGSGGGFFGGTGSDTILGSPGDDFIASDAGPANYYPSTNLSLPDDTGAERDIITGGAGNDQISAGYGDDVDGGAGTDTLRLTLSGSPAGLAIDTASLTSGGSFTIGGGTITNVESFSLKLTEFADTINIATQSTLFVVDGGGGDDVFTSNNSSVSVSGGNGNDRFITGAAGDTFIGGAGFDTIDYRNASAGVTVDLSAGTGAGGDSLSQVEGVDGSAFADDLRGNDSANALRGAAGNDVLTALGGDDTLIGGAGADTMDGGAGNDLFILEAASDSTTDAPDVLRNFEHGRDLVDVTALNVTSYAFAPVAASGSTPAYTNVTLTTQSGASVLLRIDGTANQSDFVVRPVQNGTSGPDLITGTANNDYLSGLEGNDTLNGLAGADTLQGGSGADSMTGGSGDDVYVVDQQGDQVIEGVGGGRDTVFAEASYVLASDTEIEVLSTSVNAGTTAIDLAGNAFAQVIVGNFGNNRLTSGGTSQSGGQNDVLIGLRGDDTYVVDSVRTAVIENAGEGTDSIIVTLAGSNFVLNAATSVESIVAATGTDAINITGNPDAQVLIGNDGANILSGAGGGDTLIGLGGNDTYQVRSMGDQVIEANGGGVDTVFATVSYSLGANEVEMLSTVVQAASDPINLIGNYATQVIIGNYGNNVLNGGSGGIDTLIGLLGDDTYAVGDARVIVIENAGQGNDTLVTSVSYQLRNGASIEAFTAQNRQGSESLVLIGNEFGQTIVGNEGANTLDGRGGSDLLVGGGGPDVFAFTTTPGNGNTDVILDFEAGSDRIGLASDVYSAVTSDGINAGEFVLGTAAQDADDRLIFDRAGGRLFYDADGNGSGAAVLIATFQNPAQLDVNSFVVIPPVSDLVG